MHEFYRFTTGKRSEKEDSQGGRAMLKPAPEHCQFPGCKGKVVARCSNCLRYICERHKGDIPLLCSECSKIPESKREKETVIVIPSASPYAFIFTMERPWMRKLSSLKHAELLEEFRDNKGRVYGAKFAIDKRCISLHSRPRKRYDKL